MGLSRRNVLLGLGTLIAGGGAVLGTGAFTTVEAQRTVNVQTAGDASAFLAFSSLNDNVVDDSGDTIVINLDGSSSNADGINQNARSRFEELVQITNNGGDTVDTLNFEFSVSNSNDDSGIENALKITAGSNTIAADGSNDFFDSYSDTDSIGTGDSVEFGIEVDLLAQNTPDTIDSGANIDLTITAESSSS